MLLMGLVECTQLRKESLSLRISEQKPIKLEIEETKAWKKINKKRISKNCGTPTNYATYA